MKTYLVGGAVRDKLLGLTPHEHDWVVVGAGVAEMQAMGYEQVGKDFPVFLHPQTKDEYALARTERKSGKGYTGFAVSFDKTVSLAQDLERRDLTINAIAEAADGQLIDPFNGQQDIEKRLLRHVSGAFTEDPLRVLRIARFWARFAHLGFTIAPETYELLQRMVISGELEHLTPERVWLEWQKSLSTEAPDKFLQLLLDLGAVNQVFDNLQVNSASIARVKRVASSCSSEELRFASVFILQPEDFSLTGFCRRLAVPNRFKTSAQLAMNHSDRLTQSNPLSAGQLFELLASIDYWRRPERLEQLLQLRQALQPNLEPHADISHAAALTREVDAKQLLQQGLTGPEVGQALAAARQQLFMDAMAP